MIKQEEAKSRRADIRMQEGDGIISRKNEFIVDQDTYQEGLPNKIKFNRRVEMIPTYYTFSSINMTYSVLVCWVISTSASINNIPGFFVHFSGSHQLLKSQKP